MVLTERREGQRITRRQHAVLDLVARGYANKQIAGELAISEGAVYERGSHAFAEEGKERVPRQRREVGAEAEGESDVRGLAQTEAEPDRSADQQGGLAVFHESPHDGKE